MILVDADVLWIDMAVQSDARHAVNRQALTAIRTEGLLAGVTTQALLEVVGKRSYGTSLANIPALPATILTQYGLRVVPDPTAVPAFAGCSYDEVMVQIGYKMSLGDAVQAVQIGRYVPPTAILLTWNAKHFINKIVIPVLTPKDWLAARGGTP